ncbi:putative phosphosugar-binding protein [Pullulanibacillus pueri]|uniref:DUF2529 domain-containing protein n=1 Tax=Pullulanibacillus pueri TaxID=1437324 RepID=A0A8J2ZZL4_9BACL|nr:DUF2529 family protein [Pullulanibacillus pueri]MBM7681706.1 putative phosphosugar-binding protein [Pullulanibacillus pueri]GGH87073.1 hypothetical protein GCM10007096_36250 [Pullulanibacillus pueri]
MLKIYLTQLRGVLEKLIEKNEETFEDAARLLAQAVVSDGTVFIYGFEEMRAVAIEALESPNKIADAQPLNREPLTLSPMDRVILITRQDDDTSAAKLAKKISETGAMTIGMSTVTKGDLHPFSETVDVHINLNSHRALIPTESGDRVGVPSTLAALFSYHGLYFTLLEVLEDQ